MKNLKRMSQVCLLILLALWLTACFGVKIVENVKNPDRYFRRAYHQIDRIHELYPDRQGRPRTIHVLVYDSSERKIIRVSSPVWVVNACMDMGAWTVEKGEEFDFEEQYDFEWQELRDLDQIGPGLLMELDDEENKILVWLE